MRNKRHWISGAIMLAAASVSFTAAYGFSLGGLLGNSAPNGALVNTTSTAVGNDNMNVCPIALSSLGGIPPLPCGGAVPLLNQSIAIGNIRIGASPGPAVAATIIDQTGGGWCADGNALTGSSFQLPDSSVTLIMPPTSAVTTFAAGAIVPPLGSALAIPPNTQVTFSIGTPGSVTLPTGGSFLEPDGVTSCLVPAWGTIAAIGNNTLQLLNGAGCSDGTQPPSGATLVYGNSSLAIITSDIMLGSLTPAPNGSSVSFNIDTPGSIMLPAGGTFVGPMNNDTMSVTANGILTSLGNRRIQMPGDGGLLTYAPGIHAVTIIAPATMTQVTGSLPIDVSGYLYSPQTTSGNCTAPSSR